MARRVTHSLLGRSGGETEEKKKCSGVWRWRRRRRKRRRSEFNSGDEVLRSIDRGGGVVSLTVELHTSNARRVVI